MDLTPYFQSVLELDTAPLVLCDRNHTIVYMNPEAARRYAKRGGFGLVGKSLLDCHNEASRTAIAEILCWFEADPRNNRVFTFRNDRECKDVYMVALRDGTGNLIGYYEKHASRTPETCAPYTLKKDQ